MGLLIKKMKKLRTKYKWQNRELHFSILQKARDLYESLSKAPYFPMRNWERIKAAKILTDIEQNGESVSNMYWTEEELKKLKNRPAGLPLTSALKEVDGTTNPSKKESLYVTGGIKEFNGGQNVKENLYDN